MILRILISLSLLLLMLSDAWAQTADDFFHGGAQPYISNRVDKATEEVESGLKLYPDDTKLQKLYELLKRQQQSQDNQQNKEQQQQQQQQSKSDQQKQDAEKKEQQQQQAQQNQQQQEKQKQQRQQQQQQQQQTKSDDQKEQKGEPQKTYAVGQMTPQQAQQLLDAQKGEDSLLLFKPEGKPENPERKIKDW